MSSQIRQMIESRGVQVRGKVLSSAIGTKDSAS